MATVKFSVLLKVETIVFVRLILCCCYNSKLTTEFSTLKAFKSTIELKSILFHIITQTDFNSNRCEAQLSC